jgi:hypothetical protein
MNTVNQKDKTGPPIQHPEHFSGMHVEIDPGRSPIKSFFKLLGPGLITGASDDDPSGIATYSTAGASFGYATLWTAIITLPLMAVVQLMLRENWTRERSRVGRRSPSLLSAYNTLSSRALLSRCQYYQCRHRYRRHSRGYQSYHPHPDYRIDSSHRADYCRVANMRILPTYRKCFQMAHTVTIRLHRRCLSCQTKLGRGDKSDLYSDIAL